MHKTKESLQQPPIRGNSQMKDAHETELEEQYEAASGATSSEGVGVGYDAEGREGSESEKASSSADGPLSGEMTDPPTRLKAKKKKHKKGVQLADTKSNHAAANSTKTI